MTGHRVLLVEDDHGLRDVLVRGLRAEDFEVTAAVDGASALRAATPDIDAVVLDIGLPDADGRDVCQALRARGIDVPVIFLTARRDVGDRLSGFAAGGDDYLAKPFAFPELVARLNALLRRQRADDSVTDELRVDPVSHSLWCGETRVALSPTEFRLLARLLATRPGVVRRRQLKEAAWPAGAIVSDNTLDQYMSKLRKRLEDVGSQHAIRAARGIGYELV
jgi:two-component system response regulator MprA